MTTTPEDIDEAIEQNALGPKRVQIGPESVEQHSIQDQIAARNALAATRAATKNKRGLRLTKLIPPGAG